MWASAPTHFCCSAGAERLFPSSPPCQRSKISGAGVDFIALNPYNKMEYEYGLLIRCSRLPQTPFGGQAAVQKKRGQTPRDRHCERKNVSEAAFAAGRKLRHCRTSFCEKVRYERGAVSLRGASQENCIVQGHCSGRTLRMQDEHRSTLIFPQLWEGQLFAV